MPTQYAITAIVAAVVVIGIGLYIRAELRDAAVRVDDIQAGRHEVPLGEEEIYDHERRGL